MHNAFENTQQVLLHVVLRNTQCVLTRGQAR
jgi:hypothetical protein